MSFKTKKSLGQHFLRSPHALDTMIEAAAVSEKDTVVEIGPGEGVLTDKLLQTGAHVIAYEADSRLIPMLTDRFNDQLATRRLTLVHQDVRMLDYDTITKRSYKVIANIPYYITGEIIQHFLSAQHKPSSVTLLIQKEVAERIVARDDKQSLLSIAVKAYGEPRYIKTVKKTAFFPPPKVDSAILHIGDISAKNFQHASEERFFAVVKAGFAHKRKVLSSNLKGIVDETNFAACTINPKTRAEELGVEEWLCLAQQS